ncbi:MAG: mismatch-specific DNA-glycosylase [Actinomycetes bacterium]
MPDFVGAGLRLLVVGLNPREYAADAGVGFARPGNRFWPAALAAGIVTTDRDPLAAVTDHGTGMTDLVKRATRTAAEVTVEEFRAGGVRLAALVGWLAPQVVCVAGITGWRHAVDRRAVVGPQATPLGGRPVYVMPNPSGLNTHDTVTSLAAHLRAAVDLRFGEPVSR